MDEEIYPFPEIISGESNWIVQVGDKGVVAINGKMVYSKDPTTNDHMLGHVKWNEKEPLLDIANKEGVKIVFLDVAEEIRINQCLKAVGFKHTGMCADVNGDLASLVNGEYKKMLPGRVAEAVENALKPLFAKEFPSIDDSILVARALEEIFPGLAAENPVSAAQQEEQRIYRKRGKGEKGDGKGKRVVHKVSRIDAEPGEEEDNEDIPIHEAEDFLDWHAPKEFSDDTSWGRLNPIRKPPLLRHIQCKLAGRKKRKTDIGASNVDMSRFVMDKRIFEEKGRKRVGSLLIDASGSMSMTQDKLFKYMDMLPYAVIAMYSGRSSDGYLDIIARGGFAVDKMPDTYGGNVVDFPALKWLALQEAPRIWLSDGYVSGPGGAYHDYTGDINKLMKKKLITRIIPPGKMHGGSNNNPSIPGMELETFLRRRH